MKITFELLRGLLFGADKLQISAKDKQSIDNSFHFLEQFSQDKVIYGINTGFGPMVQWHVEDQHLKDLQYNIIRSHATGAGMPLDDMYVKAAMVARLGSFLQCKSGVHTEIVDLLKEFINRDIIPFIPEHGSVGAMW